MTPAEPLESEKDEFAIEEKYTVSDERPSIKIAVIGTAGRQRLIEPAHVVFMANTIRERLKFHADKKVVLVSGGAAGADHTAVILGMQRRFKVTVELHLPCPWDPAKEQFLDTGHGFGSHNPGRTANWYHRKYSKHLWKNDEVSLLHLARLIDGIVPSNPVKLTCSKGFLARNGLVALADEIHAFTFGEGDSPADGGTADTWRKARARIPQPAMFHYTLRKVINA